MMTLLKPVIFRDRKPIEGRRYVLRLFGGANIVKRWLPNKILFSRVENATIENWYQDVTLPTIEDMHFIVDSQIPPAAHPREKELMQKGARLAMEHLYELIRRA